MVCEVNNAYVTSRARDTQEMWFLTENGVYNVYTLGGKQDELFFTVIESIIG